MFRFIGTAIISMCVSTTAFAQDYYISGQIGLNSQSSSSNSGEFTSAFTTGNGAPAIPDGTVLANGTSVGWETEFDNSLAVSGAFGVRYSDNFRGEIELAYSKADVDTHTGVTAGGGSIDAVDAAVLTGSATQLGASVGAIVADGQGELESLGVFVNGYYDFANSSSFTPYIGAGLGYQQVDVTFNPSGVPIVDDSNSGFAYQAMVGATFEISNNMDIFAQYTYRASDDVGTDVSLFPASLDVESQSNIFGAGIRFKF